MLHTLPDLPYAHSALEPHIDARTMEIHHGQHHAGYVKNLNAALEKHPDLQKKSVEELLRHLPTVPEDIRTAVRNNAGGHANHSMFWTILAPKTGGPPSGRLGDAVKQAFGGVDHFQQKFIDAGTRHFGSGWVWLVGNRNGRLEIITTPNQDSPFMQNLHPILGNDLWEHAYYLKYLNRRADYLQAWWNAVNWEAVNKRYEEFLRQTKRAAA